MSLHFARYKRWVDDQRKEREIAGRKVLYHLEDAESMQRKHEALLQQHSQISGRYALQPGQEVTREIRDVATKILGDAGARLVDNMPPWISLYSRLQLIMESVEADHRAQGGNKAGTRRAPTKQLLYSGRYQRPELDRKGLCSQQAARVLRQRWEELAEIFDCVGDDAIATIHTKQFWAKTKRGGVFSSCGTRA